MSGSALAFACVLLAACSPTTTGLGEGSGDEAAGTAATETTDDEVGSDTDGSSESADGSSTESADDTTTTDEGESTTTDEGDTTTTDEGESTTDEGDTTTTDGGTDTTDGGTDTTTDGGTDTTETTDDGMMAECGNDILDPGEDCDGLDLNAEDCYSLGFLNGNLACNESCEFDLSTCYAGAEGDPCAGDDNCQDYCKDDQCWDGSSGDPCDEFQGHCNGSICVFGNCV
ncbi:hypothetical protein PPSIR1_26293 [Plesiocystis pacifica SIR-1]|uniref:Uncharacterized protein n=1 Tax=Plesiocystis pacifica SIR-1 TaxID=391625 RepID=A6G9W9_9BACT|nr:hypothetical protein [Plesiocystis pacifica]EDM77294.1 hypothetical protein PPSIR1_26293 [Plesiocystis pacifica SIR-1]